LDENLARTLEELSEELNVGCCCNQLFPIVYTQWERFKKKAKRFPHELSELTIQNRLTICTSLLSHHKKKQFLYQIVTGNEKWIYGL